MIMHVSEFKKWIASSSDKFLRSKALLKESKDDPPEEPYKSKYKAKDILASLLSELEERWGEKDDMQIAIIRAFLKYELGVIALETEEYSLGCDHLTESWEIMKNFSVNPECCSLVLHVLNQLGILWTERGDSSKALLFLKEAENLYITYKENNKVCPSLLEDMFKEEITSSEDWGAFEKIHTLTLYYLAQVYEHLGDSEKSAKYCHMTLKRQRESEAYDEKEWSVNSATLSQYYIQEKKFVMARHLLACATCTLAAYESSIDNRVDNEDVWDDICRAKAEVAWCWLKYSINLLIECQSLADSDDIMNLDPLCKLTDDNEVHNFEQKVPCFVYSFEEARQVFLFGQNQVKEAKRYYTISEHANNYVQLIQDHSKLYKHLIFYETDRARQCKMHKRRIDMLEDVLAKLNPQYYLAVCRQLRFELGETYYELIDLKLGIVGSSEQGMVASAVRKINSLIIHAMDHFRGFIDSLKRRDGSMPEEFEDDLVRPLLIAHFYLAGLFLKLIESDTPKKLENISKSEENYKFILGYVEKNPSQANYVDKELPVIKEMIQLMPERKMQVTGSVMF